MSNGVTTELQKRHQIATHIYPQDKMMCENRNHNFSHTDIDQLILK